MKKQMKELNEKFKSISRMGYVKADNNYSSGLGTTFERLIGKEIDYFEIPDYKGIEIKAKLAYTKAPITLFNASPDGDYLFEIRRIYETYGYLDLKEKKYRIFQSELCANKINMIGSKRFSLHIDDKKKKIYMRVTTLDGLLIEEEVSWSFEMLKEKLYRKLSYLALVEAWPNRINGIMHYKYYKITFYKLKSFDAFLELLRKGYIKIVFGIGEFKSGKRKGQIHDHGTMFKINKNALPLLFDIVKDF